MSIADGIRDEDLEIGLNFELDNAFKLHNAISNEIQQLRRVLDMTDSYMSTSSCDTSSFAEYMKRTEDSEIADFTVNASRTVETKQKDGCAQILFGAIPERSLLGLDTVTQKKTIALLEKLQSIANNTIRDNMVQESI